jgi:hypothetical protein
MIRALFHICLFVAAVSTTANAQPSSALTGMDLYNWCNSQDEQIKTACLGYVNGFVDGYVMGQEGMQTYKQPLICLPSGVSVGQMQLITQKAMRDHPELLNQTANAIMLKALLDAYRCKPGEMPKYGPGRN